MLLQVTRLWQIWRAAVTLAKSWDCLEPANSGEMSNHADDENFKQSELFQLTLFPGNSNKEIRFQEMEIKKMAQLCFKLCASLLPAFREYCMSFIGLWTNPQPTHHKEIKYQVNYVAQRHLFFTDPCLLNKLSIFFSRWCCLPSVAPLFPSLCKWFLDYNLSTALPLSIFQIQVIFAVVKYKKKPNPNTKNPPDKVSH